MRRRSGKLSELEPFDPKKGAFNVIIETTRGARTKLTYDPERDLFEATKVLPEGMSFPFDFGFIPSTKADDGDPLDVLVLTDEPLPTGTLVPSRLIGVIEARQTERDGTSANNHRLVAVANVSVLFADVRRFDDLPAPVTSQIEHFFISYNEQAGKTFEPRGRNGYRKAETIVEQASRRYKSRKRSARTSAVR